MKLSQSKLFLANQVNAEQTINSGQVFLWEQLNHSWYGIDGQNIIKITQEPFSFESLILYLIRWELIYRWVSRDAVQGEQVFEQLANQAMGEFANMYDD